MIGIARKANRLSLGFESANTSIKYGKSFLVITAADLSENTKGKLQAAADLAKIKLVVSGYNIFDLSNAVGQKTGIIAVNDLQFAKRLTELLNEK